MRDMSDAKENFEPVCTYAEDLEVRIKYLEAENKRLHILCENLLKGTAKEHGWDRIK